MDPKIQSVKMRFSIIGNNEQLERAIDIAMQVAPTDLSVLITGESGVGKENFPQIIHQNSARKHKRYIAVNCGAIPEGTIDSELFGHEKGAFTGAISSRNGYFAEADGGTIFLDEVGELPLATQARLLRVLESGEYIKVGSSQVHKTDVRIVAATNVKLQEAISEGRFREDLFYRLNTVPIIIPPLRERGNDIWMLFRKFAADSADKYKMPTIQMTEAAKQKLLTYTWPGNVRQLKNITEQISILESSREITPEILDRYLPVQTHTTLPALTPQQQQSSNSFETEREILYKVLFDMRNDMTDLKKLVNDLMEEQNIPMTDNQANYLNNTDYNMVIDADTIPQQSNRSRIIEHDHIQDTEEWEELISLGDVERNHILKALKRFDGNRKQTAEALGISERTIYRKMKEYGLDKDF